MTAYISNNQKKKEILARREADLIRENKRGASPEKIAKAAALVREAHIRMLQAQRSLVPPCDDCEKDRANKLEKQIEEWQSLATQDILKNFVK